MGRSGHSRPAEIELKLRRMKFPMSDEVPKHWARGSKFITHWFNAMSAVFPEGEKFFINAVRHYEDQIDDPTLREEIRGFSAQEGHHTFQHRVMNDLVARHGVNMPRHDAWTKRFLERMWENTSPEERLGITCALEHFTAIMGNQLLVQQSALEGFDPRMVPLWRWHAIEETEHKALAYDVFNKVDGGYLTRVRTQIGASCLFIPILHLIQFRLMREDDEKTTWKDVLAGFKYLWVEPGPLRKMLPEYFHYYKPSFHPWQHDNRELVERWKRSDEASYEI
jgi:predicted metal-dependent hydrolase